MWPCCEGEGKGKRTGKGKGKGKGKGCGRALACATERVGPENIESCLTRAQYTRAGQRKRRPMQMKRLSQSGRAVGRRARCEGMLDKLTKQGVRVRTFGMGLVVEMKSFPASSFLGTVTSSQGTLRWTAMHSACFTSSFFALTATALAICVAPFH